jgi:hypothetical protein
MGTTARSAWKRLQVAALGGALLVATSPANAATWCELFDQILLELQEHQFTCEKKGSPDCVAGVPKVEIPDSSLCSILVSAGLVDRVYYCQISQPTEKLTSLWGHYVWSYFQFCASKDLLAMKGKVEGETRTPSITYRTVGHRYVASLEDDGSTFSVTMERIK